MSSEYKNGPHTVYDIQYHLVWATKYRYHILKGEVALRARELIRQTCRVEINFTTSCHLIESND
jgi:REP element-mobilizing transposase RayT